MYYEKNVYILMRDTKGNKSSNLNQKIKKWSHKNRKKKRENSEKT